MYHLLLTIDVSFTTVGHIDETRVISFLGVRTDRHEFGILMETCQHTKDFNSKLKKNWS